MGKVIYDMSMSLDGYVAAANRTPEAPLGPGGEQLHEWAASDSALLGEGVAELGAMIAGRRTYDDSLRWWGADGPTGSARVPLFVVTHESPADSPVDGVYTFVTDGIETALRQAKAVAGDRDVAVMGGPDIGGQYLAAGLVDEVGIHLVPVMFGSGLRMFPELDSRHVQLEPLQTIETPAATHLRFRVRR